MEKLVSRNWLHSIAPIGQLIRILTAKSKAAHLNTNEPLHFSKDWYNSAQINA
jgi:hypothetical protein